MKAWQDAFAGIVPESALAKEDPAETAEHCAQLIAEPSRLAFVAEKDGRMVGIVFAVLPDAGGLEGKIKSLFVDRPFQGQGLGAALIATVAEAFVRLGITSLSLGVFRDNHKARGFYEALGGTLTHQAPLEWGGHTLPEVHYRFADLSALAARKLVGS